MTPPYDSAVLFVHGIGEQQRGATLGEFGGSLIDSARAWYGADNVNDVPSGLLRSDDAPEHRAVLVTRPGEAPLRVLLAESCWAEEVKAPGWGALMGWLASTVPFIVQRAVDAGMRRSSRKLKGTRPTPSDVAFGALRLVQNVFAVALALLVLGVLFAVGLAARVAPVRERLFDSRTTSFPRWARIGAVLTLVPIALILANVDDRSRRDGGARHRRGAARRRAALAVGPAARDRRRLHRRQLRPAARERLPQRDRRSRRRRSRAGSSPARAALRSSSSPTPRAPRWRAARSPRASPVRLRSPAS